MQPLKVTEVLARGALQQSSLDVQTEYLFTVRTWTKQFSLESRTLGPGEKLNQEVLLNHAKRSNFPILEAEVLVKDTLSTNSDNKNTPQHLKYFWSIIKNSILLYKVLVGVLVGLLMKKGEFGVFKLLFIYPQCSQVPVPSP